MTVVSCVCCFAAGFAVARILDWIRIDRVYRRKRARMMLRLEALEDKIYGQRYDA